MSTPEAPKQHEDATGVLQATSGILYVRAALRQFGKQIRQSGNVAAFLGRHFGFEELLVPFFMRSRPFWEKPIKNRDTNSGPLGKLVSQLDGAIASRHPSHRFTGFGPRVAGILQGHDETTSCFHPINELARKHDFSMLLLACLDSSPGFSSVHAVQYELGLTRKHLDRFILRWDCDRGDHVESMIARESPGCSASFGKFYPAYERDGNLVRGKLLGTDYLFVPSARKAMAAERAILSENPRFVDCGRATCMTCRLRLY